MKFIDITGKTFNRLTVINRAGKIGKEISWNCRCQCGNLVTVAGNKIKSGGVKSCGCLADETRRSRLMDIAGQTFGWLTVIKRAPNKGKETVWSCRCECGVVTDVYGYNLKAGDTKSCGCKVAELVSAARRKPNRRTRAYSIWTNIKTRCRNPNSAAYPDYGGRSIDICDEWADSFDAFFAAVGEPPTPKHEIDRIDNERGYEPGNVRYVTRLTNANNKRRSVRITFNGETRTVPEWARLYGIAPYVLHSRIKLNWPIEKALTEPVRGR